MPTLPRLLAVYDTGVIFQAAISTDSPAERALAQLSGEDVTAIVSNYLRHEYEDILTREKLQKKYPILQNERFVQAQLRRVDALMERVDNPLERITYDRDPKDAPLINLVIHLQADFLITRDKDLLVLNRDPVFRHLCTTQVVDPVEFLREMERGRETAQRRAAKG